MDNEITLAFGNLTISSNSHENLAISSNSQHQEKVPEPTYSILKTKILSSINLIRHKKKKRPDTNAIYTYLIQNFASNIDKQIIEMIINDLLKAKSIIVKKTPQGHDSFFINEAPSTQPQEIIDIEESINASDSFLSENCSPKGASNNDQSETCPKNTQSTPSCRLNTVNESETFIDNMFEKTRTLNLKKEIISELQLILKSDFDKELQSFKNKCEKLASKSYANSINQIEILQKEIICKDHIINDLLTTIKNLTRENRNTISTSPTDTQNSDEIIEEIESNGIIQTKSKQNPTYGDETNKFETSNNKLIEQLTVVRQEKHKKYEEFMETKKLKSLVDKDDVNSSDSSGDSSRDNHRWPAGTCAIIGDSILTGMEDNRFQNIGRKVKIFDHSSATIDDLHHHIIPILKRKPDHIIIHVGTNDAVSKTSRQILDDLLQLKNEILKTLPNCNVIISKPTMRVDNGKAALTLKHLNEHLSQLKVDSIDNSNIKSMHIGRKGLHLNNKGKDKLALNFFHKIRNF